MSRIARLSFGALGILLLGAVLLVLLNPALLPAEPRTQVKAVPLTPEQAALTDGGQLYAELCATCHGAKGKGDGPVAEVLRMPTPDLTLLAWRAGGKYPALEVLQSLRGNPMSIVAHGTPEAPVWGRALRTENAALTDLRMHNLVEYIRTLQVK